MATYSKPKDVLDLERRRAIESGELSTAAGTPRNFQVEGNDTSAYVGVAPEYQNYASVSHKPLVDGAEKPVSRSRRRKESAEPAPE